MKKYSFLLACLALLGSAGKGFAQSEVDVLRYSRTDFGGTARTLGLSGANVALGGDAGSFSSNPAGLGLFRRSEVTVSAGLNFNETNSTVFGSAGMDTRNNLNIPQLGIVISSRKADDEEGDWRSGSFGLGFTRLNNFNQRIAYRGTSPAGALKFAEYADQLANQYGVEQSDYYNIEDLAFATGLINYDEVGKFYYAPDYSFVPEDETQDISRVKVATPFQELIDTKGAQNQWDLSYGASFRDKLFLGASIGITTVNFKQTRTYTETGPSVEQSEQSALRDFTLQDNLSTEGTGVMLKVGAIYRPTDALRLGVSIQTPTWYTLVDRYSTSLTVNYTPGVFNNDTEYASTVPGEYEYNLTTPFRASGGAAVFIGKNGFLTADVEYVNYGSGRLSSTDDSFQDANQATRNNYQSVLNYRFGAEARIDVFRLRGGVGLYGDPMKNSEVDQSKTFFTGGIGLRQSNYFIDAALVYSKYKSVYSPYSNSEFGDANSIYNDAITPLVENDHENTNFVVTFGWNF
ncbi:MAG: OmpP1/FadL family transporter [Rufibacter sp.]